MAAKLQLLADKMKAAAAYAGSGDRESVPPRPEIATFPAQEE